MIGLSSELTGLSSSEYHLEHLKQVDHFVTCGSLLFLLPSAAAFGCAAALAASPLVASFLASSGWLLVAAATGCVSAAGCSAS